MGEERAGGSGRAMLALAAIVVVAAGVKLAAWIIAPLMLALVLVVVASPARRFLIARGWPRWAGTLAAQAVLVAIVLAFALVLTIAVAQLSALALDYGDEAAALRDNLEERLAAAGVGGGEGAALASKLDFGTLVNAVTALLGSVTSVAAALFLILGVLLFMALDAGGFGSRLDAVARTRPGLARGLRTFASGTRRYLLVATVFGFAVAVLDGVALWLLGVPLPLLWALLAFITNYIPNIGFVIGLVPPALLALLDGGLATFLWVVVIYCAVNVVLQVLIQPKVVGDSVDLSATVAFVSVIAWAWLLGGIGAILAIPLTLLVKYTLIDADPRTVWVGALIDANTPKRRR
ncbi:AI-2E family transporter [Glycomyces sp. NPDC048151]|uniref:AI-2E family transporter n=1 Tax=Glycomyces sp. NPDC048151 TaxID=3364002 RepID=UPI0037148036